MRKSNSPSNSEQKKEKLDFIEWFVVLRYS